MLNGDTSHQMKKTQDVEKKGPKKGKKQRVKEWQMANGKW
jgi:hypothetical protein